MSESAGAEERVALYKLYDANDRLLYVGVTKNTEQRWEQHRKTKFWWDDVARREVVAWYDRRSNAHVAERRAILSEKPLHNDPRDPQGPTPGALAPKPADTPESRAIEARLVAAKERVPLTDEIRRERQAAALAAVEVGISKYRIAALLGISNSAMHGLIKAARANRGTL